MKMTIEPTSKVVHLNGLPARVWEGATEGGARVFAFVTRVAPLDGEDASELDEALVRTRAPSPELCAFPERLTL